MRPTKFINDTSIYDIESREQQTNTKIPNATPIDVFLGRGQQNPSEELIYDIESHKEQTNIIPIAIPIDAFTEANIVQQRHQQELINEAATIRSLLTQTQETENEIQIEICGKVMILLLLMIVPFPIIVCDMFYAYNDESCVNEYPKGLNMNMKDYLLVCAYLSIIILTACLGILCIASKKNIDLINTFIHVKLYWLFMIINVFTLVWHIMGAVIFWGTLYPEKLCDNSPSSYFFASLIIKLLHCTTFFKSKKRE